jgi:hypothetical protein
MYKYTKNMYYSNSCVKRNFLTKLKKILIMNAGSLSLCQIFEKAVLYIEDYGPTTKKP